MREKNAGEGKSKKFKQKVKQKSGRNLKQQFHYNMEKQS